MTRSRSYIPYTYGRMVHRYVFVHVFEYTFGGKRKTSGKQRGKVFYSRLVIWYKKSGGEKEGGGGVVLVDNWTLLIINIVPTKLTAWWHENARAILYTIIETRHVLHLEHSCKRCKCLWFCGLKCWIDDTDNPIT